MKVYHASSVVVDIPNTSHSREHLDFGKGFYVTTLEHQAVEYGQRFLRRGRKAWLNVVSLATATSYRGRGCRPALQKRPLSCRRNLDSPY